ncbi:MAG TPA: hypothetical protein VGQ44_15285 [Gemmatimonadaceae bacterium]|nr:hypothetical protein [Gemmatimonadaceae bacterium]
MAEYQRRPAGSDVLPPRIAGDSPAARSPEGQLGLLHGYFTIQAYGGLFVNVYRHLRREADALDESGVYALD